MSLPGAGYRSLPGSPRALSAEVDAGSAKKSAVKQRPRDVPRPNVVGCSSSDGAGTIR